MAIYDNPLELETKGLEVTALAQSFKQIELIERIQNELKDCKPKQTYISFQDYMKLVDKFLIDKFSGEKLTYKGKLKNGYIQRYRRTIERHYRSDLSSSDVERICNAC